MENTLPMAKRQLLAAATAIASAFGCSELQPPTNPGQVSAPTAPAAAQSFGILQSGAAAQNQPPVLIFRTTPRANMRTEPFPTVSGPAPLTVTFNLCHSFDPDPEDQLNWQFHFGDSGSSGWDFAHFCRAEHTYRAGCYEATLAVTDRHLEDQSRTTSGFGEAAIFARAVQQLTINAGAGCGTPGGDPPPAPSTPFRNVFATSTEHDGNLGGVAGGDGICQARAAAAGLAGTYKAWLSGGGDSPSIRFTKSSVSYRLVDGTQVADNWDDLTDGTLDHAIDRNEFGTAVTGSAWTGTAPNGTPAAGGDGCEAWLSSFIELAGGTGITTAQTAQWTQSGAALCVEPRRLYCFQQ